MSAPETTIAEDGRGGHGLVAQHLYLMWRPKHPLVVAKAGGAGKARGRSAHGSALCRGEGPRGDYTNSWASSGQAEADRGILGQLKAQIELMDSQIAAAMQRVKQPDVQRVEIVNLQALEPAPQEMVTDTFGNIGPASRDWGTSRK